MGIILAISPVKYQDLPTILGVCLKKLLLQPITGKAQWDWQNLQDHSQVALELGFSVER